MPSMLRGYVQRHVVDIQLFEGFRRREFFKDYTRRLGSGAVLGLCTLEGRPRCGGLGRGEPRWRLGLWPCLLGFFQFRDLFLKRLSCRAPAPSVPNFAPARVNVSRCGLFLGRPYLGLLLQVRHCAARSCLPFGLPLRRRDQLTLHPLVRPALARTQAGVLLGVVYWPHESFPSGSIDSSSPHLCQCRIVRPTGFSNTRVRPVGFLHSCLVWVG